MSADTVFSDFSFVLYEFFTFKMVKIVQKDFFHKVCIYISVFRLKTENLAIFPNFEVWLGGYRLKNSSKKVTLKVFLDIAMAEWLRRWTSCVTYISNVSAQDRDALVTSRGMAATHTGGVSGSTL